ncbi:MAG: protein kinase domain-containing protein [Nannocystales bacterium]
MAASKGTIIEGLYELTDDGEDLGNETRFVGLRISDASKVDVRIVGPSASGAARKQFSTVAALLGRVDHLNCLSALGAGQLVDQSLYTVTEMAVAGPLTGMIGQSLPDRELAEVGLQLLRGLEHLHNQGIVLGHVTPKGVVLGEQGGYPRLQIVDFSFARVVGQVRGPVSGVDPHWFAPEFRRSGVATEASDIFSAGRVLEALAPPHTAPVLLDVIESLLAEDPGLRPLASEACFRLAEFVEDASRPFDLEWLPSPEITAISSGLFEIPTADEGDYPEPTASIPGPQTGPAGVDPVFEEPPKSRRGLGLGLLLAGVAAAGLVFVATNGGADNSTPQDGVRPPSAASVAGAPPAPPGAEPLPTKTPVSAAKPEGNPIVWLSQVNRTDLGAVLPLRQRRKLLAALAEREGVNERVNERWNSMLDLWQANDADRPCATFAAALASLEGSPNNEAERDLIDRVVVPTSAPGSRAGVDPDDSCIGLSDGFEEFKAVPDGVKTRRSNRKRSSRRSRASSSAAKASPSTTAPASPQRKKSKTSPSKPSSVATKLDEDLRDL